MTPLAKCVALTIVGVASIAGAQTATPTPTATACAQSYFYTGIPASCQNISPGNVPWQTPGNATADDGTSTTDSPNTLKSLFLSCTQYNMSVPEGAGWTVHVVTVTIGDAWAQVGDPCASAPNPGVTGVSDRAISAAQAGVDIAPAQAKSGAANDWPATPTPHRDYNFDGRYFTASQVNATDFGSKVQVGGSSPVCGYVDYMQITAEMCGPTFTPTITPTNTPTSTPTITPTITPTFTPTATPTSTPTPTMTPTDTLPPVVSTPRYKLTVQRRNMIRNPTPKTNFPAPTRTLTIEVIP